VKFRILVSVSIVAVSCAAQSTPKEAQDLAVYPLTMDHVARQYQALTDLTVQTGHDPEMKRQFQGWASLPLDQQIHLLETNGKTAAIAKTNGITPRDLVMTMKALVAVMTAFPSIEAGKGPNQLNKLEFAASSPDHVKFFRDHQAEIMKLATKLATAAVASTK
jgi:hypothetical protein